MLSFYEQCQQALKLPLQTDNLILTAFTRENPAKLLDFFESNQQEGARIFWDGTGDNNDSAGLLYSSATQEIHYTEDYIKNDLMPELEKNMVAAGTSFFLHVKMRDTGKSVGFLAIMKDEQDRTRLTYFVLPSLRRRGLASEAYNAALQTLIMHKLISGAALYAETALKNTASQAFLLAQGFHVTGETVTHNHGPSYTFSKPLPPTAL